eukprot:GHVQ01014130.1.p1 GENE.GHVQ01014130.1~~GHVQ01014130.1.p1  ORF type:complete len:138 (-),score=1.22 GHVQ01014130.1:414-827(-)
MVVFPSRQVQGGFAGRSRVRRLGRHSIRLFSAVGSNRELDPLANDLIALFVCAGLLPARDSNRSASRGQRRLTSCGAARHQLGLPERDFRLLVSVCLRPRRCRALQQYEVGFSLSARFNRTFNTPLLMASIVPSQQY